MRARLFILAAPLLLAVAPAAAGQQPAITNGSVTTQAAGSPFVESFRSMVNARTDAGWIGYDVPIAGEERAMCCSGNDCCGTCRLEPGAADRTPQRTASAGAGPIPLEGSDRMTVLFRAVDRRVERIRFFSRDCVLDAGGRPVVWLEHVPPAESIRLLESMVQPSRETANRVTDGAIAAIALHGDPSADASLERLAAANRPEPVRKKVAFWLGTARGARGLEQLRRMLREDPSIQVRKSAVFAVSQSADPSALEELLATARSHAEPALRAEAIFWLGQKAGAKVAAALTERIEQDPDTEVKKRAVFALSQFPKDEGVPLLIEVARTNSNPAVRKQAMFWLAQSRDPRAIEFFAEILK
jgi:hypothetical protein